MKILLAPAAAFLIAAGPAAPAPTPSYPPDAVTTHTIALGGRTYAYTARAGSIALENEKGETNCRMF